MTGFCASCSKAGDVYRYRLQYVGLRWMEPECVERLRAIGMDIQFEPDAEPRRRNERVANERRRSLGDLFRAARRAASPTPPAPDGRSAERDTALHAA